MAYLETDRSRPQTTSSGELVKSRSRWTGPAVFAVVSLIIIQVCVGILLKVVQENDKYVFSPSSTICMGEFLKLMSAAGLLFFRPPSEFIHHYISLRQPRSSSDEESTPLDAFDEDEQIPIPESTRVKWNPQGIFTSRMNRRHFANLWATAKKNLKIEFVYGFLHLALLYALMNNLSFVLYNIADPGTVNLVKSSTTLITVLIIYFIEKSAITSSQWIAVALQVCGLLVTQYRSGGGSLLGWNSYGVLLLHTFTGCVASVYNSNLYKRFDVSVHLGNMVLYAAGTFLNLLIHFTLVITTDDEPSFFAGYDRLSTWMILFSGILVSLAMTAVFKYADAVIRAMASSLATGILIYLSHIFFFVELPFVVLPGTIVIFLATWLYTKEAVTRDDAVDSKVDHNGQGNPQEYIAKKHGHKIAWQPMCITFIYTLVIISAITGIMIWKESRVDFEV